MCVRPIFLRGALSTALLASAMGLAAGSNQRESAPRFSAITTTGEKFTNDSIKGKVALFEFWTTWCGYCADEAAFVEQHPRDCKIVLMEETNLAAMYQATSYPIYVVIDRDGFIAGTQRGAGGEDALRRLIARAGIESSEDSDSDPASY